MTLGLVALAVACAGTLTLRDFRLGIPGVLELKVDEISIHFRLFTSEKYYVTFKKGGEPISQACIEGGEGTIANPNGGDWDQLDYSTEKPATVLPVPNDGLVSGLDGFDGLTRINAQPISLKKQFLTGCIQGSYDTTAINTSYTLTVSASSNDQASALSTSFGQNGPGAPVSTAIHVDSYLRWTVIGSDLVIASTKVGSDLVAYQLTINGSVVADLAAGVNVNPLDEGNGWKSVWSVVPLSDLALGVNTIDVVQRGVGETTNYPIHLEFEI